MGRKGCPQRGAACVRDSTFTFFYRFPSSSDVRATGTVGKKLLTISSDELLRAVVERGFEKVSVTSFMLSTIFVGAHAASC